MIAWTDIESTGLDPRKEHLLEVALVITDDELNEILATSLVMKPVGIEIDDVQMDPYVREMHTRNGLLDEVRKCTLRRHEAEERLIKVVTAIFGGMPLVPDGKGLCKCGSRKSKHVDVSPAPFGAQNVHEFDPLMVPAHTTTPLAGSTVSFDRAFLKEHMMLLEAMFSYRSIDVSALTELSKRWSPETYKFRPKAADAHRALADVRESINYLKFFRWSKFVGGCP